MEREREREREGDRQTERETDRAERQTETETERERRTHTSRCKDPYLQKPGQFLAVTKLVRGYPYAPQVLCAQNGGLRS